MEEREERTPVGHGMCRGVRFSNLYRRGKQGHGTGEAAMTPDQEDKRDRNSGKDHSNEIVGRERQH